MNLGQAFLILLALAASAGANKKPNLRKGRDLATSRHEDTWHVDGYKENLGVCHGAVCGLWGDPHILTCDGLGYDCNAQGLFTLMTNFLYNIQANFIHVNTLEMIHVIGWGNFPVATYTNDIIIQNVYDENVPVMQFTFPHFNDEEGIIPSEVGCFVDMHYEPELHGYGRSWENTIEDCRARCESIPTCTKFTYKQNTHCRLAGEDGVLRESPHWWSRRVSGPVNQCGHPDRYAAIDENSDERAKAKIIGNGSGNQNEHWRHGPGCPVNFYKEGELIDISDVPDDGYLYGDSGSANYAKFEGFNQIKVVSTTESGALSEIMLETSGDGPGELFSCHWNMFVCLPEAHQDLFESSIGIMGSPDNNSQNDWMRPDGHVLTLPSHEDGREGQEAYDYCRNNWCVSQSNSLMTYPEGSTYENVKCVNEDFVPVHVDDPDFACLETADYIHSVCDSKPMMLRNACEVECCLGNCPAMDDMTEEIKGIVELSEKEEDCIYPSPSPPPAAICDDSNFLGTGETVCPDTSSSIVRVIDSSTTAAIPDGQPIIYGITLKEGNDDHGREVTFRVDNPFESNADTYVRYSKVVSVHAQDPACDDLLGVVPGCNTDSQEITAGCIDHPGQDPFAIVDIYFASDDSFVVNNANAATEVEKCCGAPDYGLDFGVIKYTFKIQCVCPTTA